MHAPLFPSGPKGDLLLLLKRMGQISFDDATATTGLTRTTLRGHLGQLERDGLVVRSTHRTAGRGRPGLRYRLTPEGERLFPSRDGHLLGRLLSFLKEEGQDELIQAFFERYWEERWREIQYRLGHVPAGDWRAQTEVLAEVLREQGFMPEVDYGPDGLVIRECNCPFPEAVKRTRLPCRLEAQFFERLFGQHIGRVSYIPDGAPACTYEFPERLAA